MMANVSVVLNPVWPWSIPYVGVTGLLVLGTVLALVTALTYLIGQKASPRRFILILAIRLGALAIAFLLVLRPSFAFVDSTLLPSKLLLLIDKSESMKIGDEFNNLSRWDAANTILQSPSVSTELKRLQDQYRVEIDYYMGADLVEPLKVDSQPDGKRTNMGLWLNQLFKRHGSEANLLGLVLFSEGADNDSRFSAIDEAKRWRGINCPIYPLGLGRATTTPLQRDLYFLQNKIFPPLGAIPTKSKLKVTTFLNAPGFENARVTLRMFLDNKEVGTAKQVVLSKSEENEIPMECDAPAKPGDYRVTIKVDPLPGELSKINNEISSFVAVSNEGVSILWVEGKKRAFESVFAIRHALGKDPRFRVYYTERLPGSGESNEDWYQFTKRNYDVIVIGDISGSRFSGGDEKIFSKLKELVKEKTGLLILGGYESLGNSDWQKYQSFLDLLPVKLDRPGQVNGSIKMLPTQKGYEHFVMRLAEDQDTNEVRWQTLFAPLDGITRLGTVKDTAVVLAQTPEKEPIMVWQPYGKGRVLVFGGDTTWKSWRRSYDAIAAYERFWQRLMLWMAGQEMAGGSVWVKLDTRRLPAASNTKLGLTVGLRSKSGKIINEGNFQVRVIGPNQQETDVSTFLENGQMRSYYWKTNYPGEYRVVVTGKGRDEKGETIEGTAEASFLAYAEDIENMRPAANHELLSRIAQASGGQFQVAGEVELVQLLKKIREKTTTEGTSRATLIPDWKRDPTSSGISDQLQGLWQSGILICYLAFSSLLCLEWFLRRRWGMV